MGTFRITVEIADPLGQHFEAVEMLVDTGATFTKAPRDLLERLGVPAESTYTAELADGSRVERTRGRTVIRLEGREFPTPVTFGEDGEQNLTRGDLPVVPSFVPNMQEKNGVSRGRGGRREQRRRWPP